MVQHLKQKEDSDFRVCIFVSESSCIIGFLHHCHVNSSYISPSMCELQICILFFMSWTIPYIVTYWDVKSTCLQWVYCFPECSFFCYFVLWLMESLSSSHSKVQTETVWCPVLPLASQNSLSLCPLHLISTFSYFPALCIPSPCYLQWFSCCFLLILIRTTLVHVFVVSDLGHNHLVPCESVF